MTNKLPAPLNGRLIGFALAVVAVAVALRVAWTVIQPVLPSLIGQLAIAVVYRVMFRGGKH